MGENAPKRSFDSISKEWVLLAGVMFVLPVYFLVSHFTDDGKALVASVSAAMIVLVARYFWDLRKHVWFWVTIAFIVFLHVLVVLFLRPPAKQWDYVHWNRVQILPYGLLDFAIVYGIIRLVENVAKRSS
jgi:quinol-cytochrome oxidoreductase complex cytochrome b subunit